MYISYVHEKDRKYICVKRVQTTNNIFYNYYYVISIMNKFNLKVSNS